MKKKNPAKLLFGFLGLATFASLIGTVSGTLAWYAYSTRASLSYSGTSVSNTVHLQIGIASEVEIYTVDEIKAINAQLIADDPDMTVYDKQKLTEIENYFVNFWEIMDYRKDEDHAYEKYDGDDNYYYFAPVGAGLSYSFVNAYLKTNGYATNVLPAITSGSYTRGGDFSLRNSPKADHTAIDIYSSKDCYSTIPFVFRAIYANSKSDTDYVPNTEVWLTDATFDTEGDIYKALRIYVERDNNNSLYAGKDYILNPSASESGETVVAGLLDLTHDFYYDYGTDNNEVIYGDYEIIGDGGIKPSYVASEDDGVADVNNTGKTGNDYDTFSARHRNGVNYYEDLTGLTLKTAQYESLKDVLPETNQYTGEHHNKDENNPTSMCVTGDEAGHYIGRVDFTIYLEGWDHSVIDEELEHSFNLGLTFEINKEAKKA